MHTHLKKASTLSWKLGLRYYRSIEALTHHNKVTISSVAFVFRLQLPYLLEKMLPRYPNCCRHDLPDLNHAATRSLNEQRWVVPDGLLRPFCCLEAEQEMHQPRPFQNNNQRGGGGRVAAKVVIHTTS